MFRIGAVFLAVLLTGCTANSHVPQDCARIGEPSTSDVSDCAPVNQGGPGGDGP